MLLYRAPSRGAMIVLRSTSDDRLARHTENVSKSSRLSTTEQLRRTERSCVVLSFSCATHSWCTTRAPASLAHMSPVSLFSPFPTHMCTPFIWVVQDRGGPLDS